MLHLTKRAGSARSDRLWVIGAAATVLALAGCTSGPSTTQVAQTHSSRPHALPGPFTMISFQVTDGEPAQLLNPRTRTTEVVERLGMFSASAAPAEIAKQRQEATAADDETLLVIDQVINGKSQYSLFMITTGRPYDVGLNGLEQAGPNQHELMLSAPPGQASLVVLGDAQADNTPYRTGQASLNPNDIFHWGGGHNIADLDAGHDQNLVDSKTADIYIGNSGDIDAVNGAQVAAWNSSVEPTLVTCASLPQTAWGTTFPSPGYSTPPTTSDPYFDMIQIMGLWCLRTNQGRFAVIAEVPASSSWSWSAKYVVWKKPGDDPIGY